MEKTLQIEDFSFNSRQIVKGVHETIVTTKDGIRFGCNYQSNRPAPDNVIFGEFLNNIKNFFVEVDSEIVVEKPIEVIPEKVLTPPEEPVKVLPCNEESSSLVKPVPCAAEPLKS